MKWMTVILMVLVAALMVAAACAKAAPTATPRPATPTPPPPTVAPTLAPGVTPTATPPPTPTTPAGQIPFTFPVGEAAPGLYKTYEEAMKDWPSVIAAAKKEGKVQISSFGAAPAPGTWLFEAVELFKKKYDISVEFQGGRTAEQMAKLQAEKATGRHTMDVWPSGPTAVRPICAVGFCVPNATPNALEPGVPWIVSPFAERGHMATIPGGLAPGGLVYLWQRNSTLINTTREPDRSKWPKKFADLEDPYWKGKIAMEDVRNMGPIADYFDYVTRPEGVALGLGERHLQALIKNVARLYVGSGPARDAVVKGDQAVIPMLATGSMVDFVKLPKPWNWEYVEMAEGEMGWVLSCAPFTNAPHPNAARLLCDFYGSKEVDTIRGKYWGSGVNRRDTTVVWPGVLPAKIFPVDYGDPKYTMDVMPALVKGKVSQWLAEAGF